MHKVVVRSICQLSFLFYCNIYGYFRACYKLLIFTYFPETLSKVPPSAVLFCSLAVSNSSLSCVGAKPVVSWRELFAWLPLFQNHCLAVPLQLKSRADCWDTKHSTFGKHVASFRRENVCDTDCLFGEKLLIKWSLNTKGFNNLGVYSNVLNI